MKNDKQNKLFDINEIQFEKVKDTKTISHLKIEWRKSLTAPQDDMWESFTDFAAQWKIALNINVIGYICVNDENHLLQFYVIPEWLQEGSQIFEKFITQQKIKAAVIGTNNPSCLSTAMHFQKQIKIECLLFSDLLVKKINTMDGLIRTAEINDLKNVVKFCHNSTGDPINWLNEYSENLINRNELFIFEHNGEILGTFEVRKSESCPETANIGMIVSSLHRRKGLGTFLLGKAKEISLKWNRKPICSCEKENIGSKKSITNNGFRNIHQMLLLKF